MKGKLSQSQPREEAENLRSAREDALNPTEAEELLTGCKGLLDHLVVRLPLFTGMRISEVVHLKRTWIVDSTIRIPRRQACSCWECRESRNTPKGSFWHPKTRKGKRDLLIPPELEPYLTDWFSKYPSIDRTRQALWQRFIRIKKRTLLADKHCYPHALRATFATNLAAKGISPPALTYLMGWISYDPAESYIQSTKAMAHDEQRRILGLE